MSWKKRKFDGHVFWMHRFFTLKKDAIRDAVYLRRKGLKARITKAESPNGWIVWSNENVK